MLTWGTSSTGKLIKDCLGIFDYKQKITFFTYSSTFLILGALDILSAVLLADLGFILTDSGKPFILHKLASYLTEQTSISIELLIFVFGVIFSKILVSIYINKKFNHFLAECASKTNKRMISEFLESDYSWMRGQNENQVLFAMTLGLQYLFVGVLGQFAFLITDLIVCIVFMSILLVTNFLVSIILFLAFGLISFVYFKKIVAKISTNGQTQVDNLLLSQSVVSSIIRSWREINVMNRQMWFVDKLSGYYEKTTNAFAINNWYQTFPKNFREISLLLVFFSGFILTTNGSNDSSKIPEAILFSAIILRLLPILARVQQSIFGLRSYVATAGTAVTLLESSASNFNRVHTTGELQQLASSPTGLSISISGLSFGYNRSSPEILHIDALEIQSGSFTALTGKSGSGKTTFIELLLGLLVPTKGTILIHGQKLEETNVWGSGQISYLSQKPHLLNATIRENIGFGAALTLADDEQIFKVLEKVDLAEKVRNLPLGLDSILEGSQLNLSGGEQQRLALARALLTSPRLLFIDEGTNALDIDTESHILKYLIALKGECTIIMSAHQQSTLQHVDQVLDFKNSSVSALKA